MATMMNDVYEAICNVSKIDTDFDRGFDILFEWMCDHPYSTTTRKFVEYHIEMGDPRLPDGRPEFTYLIGKRFIVDDWVSQEDMYAFHEYVNRRCE